jgi:signal transduction histidine kinase
MQYVYDEEHVGYFIAIAGDDNRYLQILLNFLSNALKFTKEGKVSFGFRLSDNNEIIFFVRDTGIGIELEKHY